MRFFTPAVFALTALGLIVADATRPGTIWYLPFEAVVPSLAGNYALQGQLTIVAFALLALVTGIRAWRARPEA